jgi:hypothetical protein
MRNASVVLLALLLTCCKFCVAQKPDSARANAFFSGSVSATNNGISIVPSFSLGKPAIIFNLAAGKNRFSVEPDIRFSMGGKPWSFLFWGKYKIIDKSKFHLSTGAHLGLNFRTTDLAIGGDTSRLTVARRYLAAELFPRYLITPHTTVGIYYLYAHGIDPGTIRNSHFLTINANFSNIRLSKQIYMKLNPQFYYLKLDQPGGFYFTSSLTLAKQNFPLSVSSVINKTIHTDIKGGKDFLWNLSLVYAFSKKLKVI